MVCQVFPPKSTHTHTHRNVIMCVTEDEQSVPDRPLFRAGAVLSVKSEEEEKNQGPATVDKRDAFVQVADPHKIKCHQVRKAICSSETKAASIACEDPSPRFKSGSDWNETPLEGPFAAPR